MFKRIGIFLTLCSLTIGALRLSGVRLDDVTTDAMAMIDSVKAGQNPFSSDSAPVLIPVTTEGAQIAAAVIKAQFGENALEQTFARERPRVEAQLAARFPNVDARKLLDQTVFPELRAHKTDFINAVANVVAQHFTIDELREMQAFYASPTGRKFASLQPTILAESRQVGEQLGAQIMQYAAASRATPRPSAVASQTAGPAQPTQLPKVIH